MQEYGIQVTRDTKENITTGTYYADTTEDKKYNGTMRKLGTCRMNSHKQISKKRLPTNKVYSIGQTLSCNLKCMRQYNWLVSA